MLDHEGLYGRDRGEASDLFGGSFAFFSAHGSGSAALRCKTIGAALIILYYSQSKVSRDQPYDRVFLYAGKCPHSELITPKLAKTTCIACRVIDQSGEPLETSKVELRAYM